MLQGAAEPVRALQVAAVSVQQAVAEMAPQDEVGRFVAELQQVPTQVRRQELGPVGHLQVPRGQPGQHLRCLPET